MRSKELVAKVMRGERVEIISASDGSRKTVTGEIIKGRGLVLSVDGVEAGLRVIEAEHGRSPLFDPRSSDLNDWYFEEVT